MEFPTILFGHSESGVDPGQSLTMGVRIPLQAQICPQQHQTVKPEKIQTLFVNSTTKPKFSPFSFSPSNFISIVQPSLTNHQKPTA